MKNKNQMIITDSAALRLSFNDIGQNFSEACTRFFKLASMLPPAASLGLRIAFCHDALPSVTVFSDAALAKEDYAWMFKPCAEIVPEKEKDVPVPAGAKTYFIAENASTNTERSFDTSCLVDELSTLDAVLTVLVPSDPNRAFVSLEAARELPLRVWVMLSGSFHGAKILEAESWENEPENGVPCEVASKNIQSLLSVIADRTDTVEMEKHLESAEILVPDEDEFSAPIEALDLSVRSFNCLKRAGVHTVAELRAMDKEDLMKVRNLGKKHMEEVLQKLREYEQKYGREDTGEPVTEDTKTGRERLEELIGLDEVKTQVRRITALAEMQRDRKEKGLKAKPITLNMAFVGNPGTAKTTVARVMAKILYEAGLLGDPQPIEVGRADIVGRYTGQTADNVKTIFKNAKGRLLFIDEAYSLLDEWENSFGDEAINTIVQEMENARDDTVVVFAGYPKPMEEFLSRNAGLRSRIPFYVSFADYSAKEMVQIAALAAGERGFSIHPEAFEKIEALCEEAQKDPESGNGRFCRNLVENAILSFADRTFGESRGDAEINYVLNPDDFDLKLTSKEKNKRVGFC